MAETPLPDSRRREQGAITRERVLEVATALMADRGFSGTTISAISKASGVMPASIYWHFENKEGLLAAVIDRAAEVWFRESTAAIAGADGSDPELADDFARLHYVFEEKPDFYRVLLLISLERRDADAATLAAVKRVRERCKRFIAVRLEERIPLEDPRERQAICERLSSLAMVLLDGTFVAHQIDPATPEKLVERFARIAWVMRRARAECVEEALARASEREGSER